MKKIVNIANFYILLWMFYTLQDVFLPNASLTNQFVFIILILISIYYTFVFYRTYNTTNYFNAIVILLFMFIVYGSFLLLFGQTTGYKVVSNYTYLQYALMSYLPIYPFFVFSKRGMITKNSLFYWLIIFTVALTLEYFSFQQMELLKTGWSETVNNTSYLFLVVVPMICLFQEKRSIQYVYWIYFMYFILNSFKRGAMLIGIICFVLFIWNSLKTGKRGYKLGALIAGTVLVIIGYRYFLTLQDSSELFNKRLEGTMSGDMSGREGLYTSFWTILKNQDNPLRILFGYGANGTLMLVGEYAHNDWLELAVDNGLLGVIIYIYYWICAFQTWKRCKNASIIDKNISFVIGLTFLIAFSKSLFSMSVTNNPFFVSLLIGYCLSQYDFYKVRI